MIGLVSEPANPCPGGAISLLETTKTALEARYHRRVKEAKLPDGVLVIGYTLRVLVLPRRGKDMDSGIQATRIMLLRCREVESGIRVKNINYPGQGCGFRYPE